jgi:hypothetical protein
VSEQVLHGSGAVWLDAHSGKLVEGGALGVGPPRSSAISTQAKEGAQISDSFALFLAQVRHEAVVAAFVAPGFSPVPSVFNEVST